MNKTQFVEEIAVKANLTKKQADAAYSAMISTIVETLKEGEKISLVGFGSFELKHKEERELFNPLTKERVKIAASDVPTFKMGKAFKDLF